MIFALYFASTKAFHGYRWLMRYSKFTKLYTSYIISNPNYKYHRQVLDLFHENLTKLVKNHIKFHKISTVSCVEFGKHPFRIPATEICRGLHRDFGMLILNYSVFHDKWFSCTSFQCFHCKISFSKPGTEISK